MLTFKKSCFYDSLEKIKHLIPNHWIEVEHNNIQLEPRFSIYFNLELDDKLIFVTANNEAGEIVGYFIGLIAYELHYKNCLTCHMDSVYLDPAYRKGRNAISFFKFVESELKKLNVKKWYVGSKNKKDLSIFYKYLKFEHVESLHCKWIGG